MKQFTKGRAERHPEHIRGVKRLTQSPHRGSTSSKRLFILVAAGIGLLLITAAAYILSSATSPQKNPEYIKQNKTDAVNTLGATSGAVNFAKKSSVQSSLGFTLEFDENSLNVRAQTTDASSAGSIVTGEEYTEAELSETRPYSIVKVELPEETYDHLKHAGLTVVTNIRKSFWDTRRAPNEPSIDALLRHNAQSYTADKGWAKSQPTDVKINGYDFKKVEYSYTRSYDKLDVTNRYIVYLTVQNDRPYTVTIHNATDANLDQVALYDAVLTTIRFENFDATKLSRAPMTLAAASAVSKNEALDDDVSNTPYDIKPETIFDVILRNQPAVVRVASSRCADIALLAAGGNTAATLQNACTAGIGSGSIVSKDGYVATNGHVVSLPESSLLLGYLSIAETSEEVKQRYSVLLTYLSNMGFLTKSTLRTLLDDVKAGIITDQQLVEAIISAVPKDKIKLTNDTTQYTLQLGQEAMRVTFKDKRISIPTSKTIITAKLIDQDFDSNLKSGKYEFGSGTASDVALLKADGTFPVVKIGSIDSVKAGAGLTAIGYPAFVDGGLTTAAGKTKPTVTQGTVIQIASEGPLKPNKLIVTNVPIAQGNSGGPAFDERGLQIGLNTYGQMKCPDLKCFGAGTARDVADFVKLSSTKNVRFDGSSDLSERWSDSLDEYAAGNFRGAVKVFKQIQAEYPAHYISAKMQSLAESKFGTPGDRSSEFQSKPVYIYAVLAAAAFLLLAGGSFAGYLILGSHRANKTLYANQPAQGIPQPVAPVQQPLAQVQGMQPPMVPQPPISAQPPTAPTQPNAVPSNVVQPNVVQPSSVQPPQVIQPGQVSNGPAAQPTQTPLPPGANQ